MTIWTYSVVTVSGKIDIIQLNADILEIKGIKSAVRRRIRAPVEKVVKDVQKDLAKVAKIEPTPVPKTEDATAPTQKDKAPEGASSSAHDIGGGALGEPLQRTKTTSTNKSSRSQRRHSKSTSSDSSSSDDDQQHPQFAPAAKRLGVDEDDDSDEDFDEHGFDHPSTYEAQPWIWIPKDELGLSGVLVRELKDAGVDASDEGATMDKGGEVEVQRSPPDEDWAGGHDA
jgi:calcium permeable stress-gated cation channel